MGPWRLLLAEAGTSPTIFVLPAFLMFISSVFEGISVALLVPTLEGLLRQDFTSLMQLPGFRTLLEPLPTVVTSNSTYLFGLTLAAVFAAVLLRLGAFVRARIAFIENATDLADRIRQRVMSRYLRYGKQYFDAHNVMYLQTVAVGYPGNLAQGASAAGLLLNGAFTLMIYGVIMLWLSWQLTLVALLLFPLLLVSLRRVVQRLKGLSHEAHEATRELVEGTYNVLSCIHLVKAYTQEQRETDRFAALSRQAARLEALQQRRLLQITPIQELLLLVFVVALVVAVSQSGIETPANVLVFFYILKRSSTHFNELNHVRAQLAQYTAPLQVVLDALSDHDKPRVPEGARDFPGLAHRIELDRLTFSYSPDRVVLSDLSFTIQKGKSTAIVGRTGSGKSTLISLLLRLYDVGPGMIRLDGVDIRDFNHRSLRAHMAVVTQDCPLFNATVRTNLTYGLEREVSEQELTDALRGARLEEAVTRLPQGLETEIGDRGVKLSGGEKQRLAIARALLKRSELLILDEATSSLDSRTERLVQEAIDECLKGRTAIVVAHRLATIKSADEIVLIEDGVLVERGTLDELLAARGAFHAYWEAQRIESRPTALTFEPTAADAPSAS
jgi:subfamily B ATP-binding cassette protein MsbA